MAKGNSPYRRQTKAPRRYSDLYQRRRSARLSGNDAEARTLARQHTARFMGDAADLDWREAA